MQHQHAEARRSRGLAAGETQQVETPCISMQSMQLVSCLKQVSYRTAPVLAGARHLPCLLLLAAARQPRRHPPHARLLHAHAPCAAGWVSFPGGGCQVLRAPFRLMRPPSCSHRVPPGVWLARVVEAAVWCSRQTFGPATASPSQCLLPRLSCSLRLLAVPD